MNNDTKQYKTLHITRSFNAPRGAVWDAWTKPEQLARWYAPDPFTVPVCELDVAPAGKLRIDMKSPDGTVYPSSGEYKEVSKPERLVFINSPLDAAGNKLFEILHTVILTEESGKTIMNLTSEVLHAGPGAAPYLSGMEAGLNQAIQQLENLVTSGS